MTMQLFALSRIWLQRQRLIEFEGQSRLGRQLDIAISGHRSYGARARPDKGANRSSLAATGQSADCGARTRTPAYHCCRPFAFPL